MRPNESVKCTDFPCQDVNKECYIVPNIEIDPSNVKTLMISEAPPSDLGDYFYAPKNLSTCKQLYRLSMMQVSMLPA